MSALAIPAQVRALRKITGLSLSKCRRIISLVDLEFSRNRVIRRRSTVESRKIRQLDLAEQPAPDVDIARGFAEIRRRLQEVKP